MNYIVYKKTQNSIDRIFVENFHTEEETIEFCKKESQIDTNYLYWFEKFDIIKHLKNLHGIFNFYLTELNFSFIKEIMKTFGHGKYSDEDEVNILKTVLIITKSYKEHTDIKEERQRIKEVYENICKKLNINAI